jgi:hypothetical protein
MARFDYEYVAELLKFAVREYLTACKNHVALNLVKRIEKASPRFFCALDQKFMAKNRYKASLLLRPGADVSGRLGGAGGRDVG